MITILCKTAFSSIRLNFFLIFFFFISGEECQKTGEKYVPVSRKQRQRVDDDDLDDSLKNSIDNEDKDENDSDDSLSDLYPNKMLCDENGNED